MKHLARLGNWAVSAALVLVFVALAAVCLIVEAIGAAWRKRK